ncbi:MAG: ComEC/Rec2 family competence protein [Lachnospiraceae bacterium]|nr:ComEC/Rec2 family competence protein [Lachnospiraceae bacterium]
MPVRRPVCLICLLFLVIIYMVTGGTPKPSWDVDAADGKTVTVTGTVADRQEKNGTLQVYLTDVLISDESRSISDPTGSDQTYFPEKIKGIVVKLSDEQSNTEYSKIGSSLRAKGVFVPFEPPRCEGMLDSRTYYMIRGYEGQLKRARIIGASHEYSVIREGLRRLRDEAFNVLRSNMSENDAGLVAAMTLGDKSDLDTEIKELYQVAGISHVLALSGLHIASVGLALLSFLRKTGMGERIAAVISGTVIAFYAVMTGMSVSTVRALIMFLLSVIAILIGRTYDLICAAAWSAVIILAFNPYYVYDSGFLLSFLAIVGIAFIYPVLEGIPRILGKAEAGFLKENEKSSSRIHVFISKMYQGICISLSVMIATFPVMANGFMQVSVWSVVINLAVIPLMSVVLATGFLGIIVGLCGLNPWIILKITHYILKFYEAVCETSAKIPGNLLVTGKPETWQLITYVTIAGMAVFAGNMALSKQNKKTPLQKSINRTGRHNSKDNTRNSTGGSDKITYVINTVRSERVNRAGKITILMITMVMIICSVVIVNYRKREELEIRNVDVGQGDCALIWGRSVPVIMIDGGSTDIKQVGKYRIVPVLKANKVSKIDYCFISHMDSDHVNGILEILEDEKCGITVKRVVVSEVSCREDPYNENMQRLLAAADIGKCEVMTISLADELKLGDLRIKCLAPKRNWEGTFEANDASVVLTAHYANFSALFTGDISENTERQIVSLVPDVSYLKVAHHGSRTSSSYDFLREASPEISVISVGEGNSYGHPTPEALARLQKIDSDIYRTDRGGEVIIRINQDKMHITQYMEKR